MHILQFLLPFLKKISRKTKKIILVFWVFSLTPSLSLFHLKVVAWFLPKEDSEHEESIFLFFFNCSCKFTSGYEKIQTSNLFFEELVLSKPYNIWQRAFLLLGNLLSLIRFCQGVGIWMLLGNIDTFNFANIEHIGTVSQPDNTCNRITEFAKDSRYLRVVSSIKKWAFSTDQLSTFLFKTRCCSQRSDRKWDNSQLCWEALKSRKWLDWYNLKSF